MADIAPPAAVNTDIQADTNRLAESPIPSATAPSATNPFNTKDAAFDTPPPSVKPASKPTAAPAKSGSKFSYSSPDINFEDDPNTYLKTKVESLIYWEYPKKSALFLVGSLSILVLTQYYSLLQIVAGLFTFVTGVNWIFVNTHKQGQRFIGGKSSADISNPHDGRLSSKGTYIPRDRVLRTAQLTIDVVEVIAQQITKLVLIEDNWRSAISLVASYFIWTLAKVVSTKYLVGFFVLVAFSIPRLYLQNQDIVDAHIAQQSTNARVLAEKYGGVANQKVRGLTQQASAFIKSKTSGAKPAAAAPTVPTTETKKTE